MDRLKDEQPPKQSEQQRPDDEPREQPGREEPGREQIRGRSESPGPFDPTPRSDEGGEVE
jgi:hypothetical protein